LRSTIKITHYLMKNIDMLNKPNIHIYIYIAM